MKLILFNQKYYEKHPTFIVLRLLQTPVQKFRFVRLVLLLPGYSSGLCTAWFATAEVECDSNASEQPPFEGFRSDQARQSFFVILLK